MFLTLRDDCQFKKSWLRAISETPACSDPSLIRRQWGAAWDAQELSLA